jgi:predicted amidohydrolase YtcJ
MRLSLLLLMILFVGCSNAEVDFARSLAVPQPADMVLRNGKVITVDGEFSIKEAVAIKNGRFIAVGSDRDVRPLMGSGTRVIDLGGRTVVPGLIDSHIHATLAGLSWDAELHWERTRTLADGVGQIAARVKSTPAGSWIVVGGGWVPTQFAERRFPTRAELDAIAPSHPVYVQYLRQGALLNSAALKALDITTKIPDPSGGKFERNPSTGELTGWLQGVAAWEYAYNKIPGLPLDRVRQSLRNCFRELNRLGLTSVGDLQTSGVTFAHRRLLADMARTGELSLRLSFYLAPNDPGDELEQLKRTAAEVAGLARGDTLHFVGFTGKLVAGIGDEDLLSNPKDLTISADAKEKFRQIARYSVETGQRLHLTASHDDKARQLLDVLETVHAATPFAPQRIVFAHLEDAVPDTIARIKNLGAGIAVQDRLALIGERYAELSGLAKARNAPPLRAMIDAGVPLGAGTDGFLAANYSPMLSLWWLVTGKTVAGSAIRDKSQNITRAEALRMYTIGSASLTGDERRKGSIEVDKLADLAVLNADYLTVPEDQIRSLESLLTMVGGRIVYSARPFAR